MADTLKSERRSTVKISRIIASTLVLWLFFFALAHGQDEAKIKGLITHRSADSMTVQSSDGTNYVVLLADDTKVRTPKGLGLRHNEESWSSLIPGLPVKVKGDKNEKGEIVASQVDFSKEALRTASMIQAGLAPTQRQVTAQGQSIAENKEDIEDNQQAISENARKVDDRFKALTDYDVKKEVSVYFAPGKSELAAKDKAALSQVASDATKMNGYLIEVKGFADSSGNLAMNQTLSRDRAEAVIEYLMQSCNVPARHILAPGAMGISNPASSNETSQGRADNRRVELKVMVNKAVGTSGE
jgi:OmpA-OmpF porin, OOP family